jgi:hypothetical protein
MRGTAASNWRTGWRARSDDPDAKPAARRRGLGTGERAAKAALNLPLRTTAIEACRQRPEAVFAALQPGTVLSALSAPFRAAAEVPAPVRKS